MEVYWGNAVLDISIWANLDACVIAMTAEPLLRAFSLASESMI